MKKSLIVLFISVGFQFFSQTSKGKCGLNVAKSYTQTAFGKNIGYYVEFQNKSKSAVDAIEWQADFFTNFGDPKGKKAGSWSSGNLISPIEPGEFGKDLETNWSEGATKVYITITRVHFTNGKTCK
jgi:hypothetical protein